METVTLTIPRWLAEGFTDDNRCSFDHHGYCQTHGLSQMEPGQCWNDKLKEMINEQTEDTQSEDA